MHFLIQFRFIQINFISPTIKEKKGLIYLFFYDEIPFGFFPENLDLNLFVHLNIYRTFSIYISNSFLIYNIFISYCKNKITQQLFMNRSIDIVYKLFSKEK